MILNLKLMWVCLSTYIKRENLSKLRHKIPKHNTLPSGGKAKWGLIWLTDFIISVTISFEESWDLFKREMRTLINGSEKKFHFYNSFQQQRANLGILETSNLQIFSKVSSCFRTNLHKTTNKREQRWPKTL